MEITQQGYIGKLRIKNRVIMTLMDVFLQTVLIILLKEQKADVE